jgi:hypothetical protein
MNSLRGISKKIDAILLMVMAGLALSLVLAWDYYQTRKMTGYEKDRFAAELLAYDLPQEAAHVLEESIRMQPYSDKSLKMRRALADIYMKELGQFDKALGELVFIRTFSTDVASETEEDIKFCLNRLGRTYDVDRREMLARGINPIENEVSSETIVRIGNKSAITVEQLNERLKELNLDARKLDRNRLDSIVQALAREKLLHRAADRENISRERQYIDQVRQFEESLKLKSYLEKYVFADLEVTESEIDAFIKENADRFKTPDRVKYSCFAFADAEQAERFIDEKRNGNENDVEYSSALNPEILVDKVELPKEQLPSEIRSLDFKIADELKFFGPLKMGEKYYVYQIHSFTPGQNAPDSQVREFARRSLTEQKQQELLSAKIAELAAKEEMKINEEVIEHAFFEKASSTADIRQK